MQFTLTVNGIIGLETLSWQDFSRTKRQVYSGPRLVKFNEQFFHFINTFRATKNLSQKLKNFVRVYQVES